MSRTILFAALMACGCGGLTSHGSGGSGGSSSGGGNATGGGGVGGGGSSAAGGGVGGGGSATGGGTASGGGVGTGGGSGGGASGGGTGGGVSTGGGGAATGGGSGGGGGGQGPLQFSSAALPGGGGGQINAIFGRPGEIWAATDYGGHVWKKTDGGFTELTGTWQYSSFSGGYVAPDGTAFLITNRDVGMCTPPACNTGNDFTFQTVGDSSTYLFAICGTASNDVYAIGGRDTENIGVLWHWDGAVWTNLSNDLGFDEPASCFMRPDGVMFIAGLKDIVKWESGAASLETLTTDFTAIGADVSSQYWYGLYGFGDQITAVGTKRRVLQRDVNGAWTLTSNPPQQQGSLWTVFGASASELYAVGTSYSNEDDFWAFDGGTWKGQLNTPFMDYGRVSYVAGPDDYWVGGASNSSPVVLHVHR